MRRRRPWRLCMRIVIGAAIVAVGGIALASVVVPFVLGAKPYAVLSGSMEPGIPTGALIASRPADIGTVRVGDVVTYQLRSGEPTLVTHRVVGVGTDAAGARTLITRGDANNVNDAAPVREPQVRGVVVYAVPGLGYVQQWLAPDARGALVTLLGAAVLGWGVVALFFEFRPRDRRRRTMAPAVAAAVVVAALVVAPTPTAHAAVEDFPPADEGEDFESWFEQWLEEWNREWEDAPGVEGEWIDDWLSGGDEEGEIPDGISVSADAHAWGVESLAIVDMDGVVPGDSIPVRFWVRNSLATTAEIQASIMWMPLDPRDRRDVELAAALTVPELPARTLGPASETDIELVAQFPLGSSADTRDADVELIVTVDANQALGGGAGAGNESGEPGSGEGPGQTAERVPDAGRDGIRGALATTGGVVSAAAPLLAAALGGLGAVLLIRRRRSAR